MNKKTLIRKILLECEEARNSDKVLTLEFLRRSGASQFVIDAFREGLSIIGSQSSLIRGRALIVAEDCELGPTIEEVARHRNHKQDRARTSHGETAVEDR